MHKRRWIILLPTLSYMWLLSSVLIGGMTYSNYDHLSQFISELAATGSPYENSVNYFGFIPTEILILIFVVMVISCLPKSKMMFSGMASIAIYAIALMVAAVFNCDFECRPVQPTMSHKLHIIFGMSAYLLAIIGIILLAIESRNWPDSKVFQYFSWFLGIFTFILLLNFDPKSPIVGLIQRITETAIYSWFLILAFYINGQLINKNIKQLKEASFDVSVINHNNDY